MEIELDEMDFTSAESKVTYKEIQKYVLDKHGLKISMLTGKVSMLTGAVGYEEKSWCELSYNCRCRVEGGINK